MKKTKIYLPLFVVFVLIIGLTFDVIIPNAYSLSYNDQVSNQKNNMWELGKNLKIGDSFTYKICDLNFIQNYSAESYHYFTKNLEHNSSMCYTIHLNFIDRVISDENQISGDTWIVDVAIIDYSSGEIRKSIFHIDANSWNIKSSDIIHNDNHNHRYHLDTVRLSDSIENTLFSILKYTAQESKLLQEGIKWGEVTEYHGSKQINPYMMVLDDDLKFETVELFVQKSFLPIYNRLEPISSILNVSKVGYEIDIIDKVIEKQTKKDTNNVTNFFLVNQNIPFPVEAVYFSPSHIVEPFKEYEFQLISFFNASNTIKNNNPINLDVIVDDDDITDNIIIEFGTIKLTFPDNNNNNNTDSSTDDNPNSQNNGYIINTDDTIKNNNDNSVDNAKDQHDDDDHYVTDTINIDVTIKEDRIKPKSSLMTLLVLVIGIVLVSTTTVVIFVYLKKFKKNKKENYDIFGKDDIYSKAQIPKAKTILFDDSITINITNILD
ncbi:MAG: hypothetical protein OEL56_02285 [Nitrosopumilus sp.]|nr:hypothetical protein [Nitrosopumilus sp.]MDH3489256.1 hypothetical protein [Nitrosopumilus sp.]MDH3516255.1 hypothetical protein [Nitrosopumilus sp.]MDH3564020.1 hypothetical protein [Nitrosopumilus sp.]MDH5417572.1 hypothetical protein [Nitrosopumilus sp.]